MAILSLEEFSAYVRLDAYWMRRSKNERAILVAIAPCESGDRIKGTINTENIGDNGTSFGALQIHKPVWQSLFNKYQWNNVRDNIAMAGEVHRQQGFKAWSTYKSGCYLFNLGKTRALENVPAGLPPGTHPPDVKKPTKPLTPSAPLPPGYEALEPDVRAVQNIADAIGKLSGGVGFFTDPKRWLRVAVFIAGGFVLLLATVLLIASNKTVRKTAELVPPGKVLSKAAKVAA
jgi:hypothetical protein